MSARPASRRVVEDFSARTLLRPEASLAAEVLRQALFDMTSKPRTTDYFTPHDAAEARQFCTAEKGGWAEARRKWCDLAGIEESAYRRAALKKLAGATA